MMMTTMLLLLFLVLLILIRNDFGLFVKVFPAECRREKKSGYVFISKVFGTGKKDGFVWDGVFDIKPINRVIDGMDIIKSNFLDLFLSSIYIFNTISCLLFLFLLLLFFFCCCCCIYSYLFLICLMGNFFLFNCNCNIDISLTSSQFWRK